MIELSDKTFEPTAQVSSPMLVMFTVGWAGPCNLAKPAFTEARDRMGNQVEFATFDLDNNPKTPQKYGIRQVPCFMMFVDGKPTDMRAGAVPVHVILDMCEAVT